VADRAIIPSLFWRTIIFGGITIEVDAFDVESGVNRVEFFIDDTLKHVSTGWPYEWFWNEWTFGFYTLKARAYDNAGHSNIDRVEVYILNF
jgi:hypothetical protein